MNVGFTASRDGITEKQKEALRRILWSYRRFGEVQFHHGDCVKGDEAGDAIAKEEGCFRVIHPPINPVLRAFCKGDVILPEKDYISRNHDIVNATEILIACPKGPERIQSGTWATIRYARKLGRKVIILDPFTGKEVI